MRRPLFVCARPSIPATTALLVVAGLVLAACSSTQSSKNAFEDDKPAGTLYNQGLAYLNAGQLPAHDDHLAGPRLLRREQAGAGRLRGAYRDQGQRGDRR